jgi:hypothetical protein
MIEAITENNKIAAINHFLRLLLPNNGQISTTGYRIKYVRVMYN